jgi:hypothetical protein
MCHCSSAISTQETSVQRKSTVVWSYYRSFRSRRRNLDTLMPQVCNSRAKLVFNISKLIHVFDSSTSRCLHTYNVGKHLYVLLCLDTYMPECFRTYISMFPYVHTSNSHTIRICMCTSIDTSTIPRFQRHDTFIPTRTHTQLNTYTSTCLRRLHIFTTP